LDHQAQALKDTSFVNIKHIFFKQNVLDDVCKVRPDSTDNVEIVRLDIFRGCQVQIWDLLCMGQFLGDVNHFVYVQKKKKIWTLTT